MKKLLLVLSALLGIILFINVAYASDDYPDISSKYDANNMSQYSDDDLGQLVTMKNFYVQGISYDKHHKRIAVGDSITIKGSVGPRQELENSAANRSFSKSLIGKNMIFVLTDSYK